jgi:hypothetical protein
MKLLKLLKEAAYQDASSNELALYLSILSKELSAAKSRGEMGVVELLTQDVEEVKKELKSRNISEDMQAKDRKAYKDKNNPNFLYVDFKYGTGGGGFLSAMGTSTMSGQVREKGAAAAKAIAEKIATELNKQYDLEDLDVVDKENGVVQIFAVSDDFISINPDTDSKLKNIVNKF